MFNDKYGQTDAVIAGHKTMTRRIAKGGVRPKGYMQSTYQAGDVVAVAESYMDVWARERKHSDGVALMRFWRRKHISDTRMITESAGWKNKRFVRAYLMPYNILITNVKVERLQDIRNIDCICEGIIKSIFELKGKPTQIRYRFNGSQVFYDTPKEAFAALIDNIYGHGTWDKNPWVFAYEFKLVKPNCIQS